MRRYHTIFAHPLTHWAIGWTLLAMMSIASAIATSTASLPV